MRFYGGPVLAIELFTIGYAFVSGFEPLRVLRSAPAWVQAALLTLVAIAFYTALVVAADRLLSVSRTLMWFSHLMFGMSVAYLSGISTEFVARYFWPTVVGGLCGYALVLVLFVAMIPDPAGFDWFHLRLAVVNVRQVGFYSAAGAAAALGLLVSQTRWSAFLASAAAASVLFCISFWSGTRGSIFAVWAAFAAGLIWFPGLRSARTLCTLVATTAFGAMLSLLHSVPNPHYGIARLAVSAVQQSAEEVSSGRLSMWLGTYQAILQRPLFGYGESQFRTAVPASLGWYNHPHNVFLQIAVQWGFVGGVCFLALSGWLAWRAYVVLGTGNKALAPAFLVLVSLLTMAMYEGTLYHTYPIMMIALSLAVIIGSKAGPGTP
jgi:O-antigen ligase